MLFEKLKEIEKEDVALFGFTYWSISTFLFLGTTGIIYKRDPLKKVRNHKFFQLEIIKSFYKKAEESKIIGPISERIPRNPKKLNKALVESFVINHASTPIAAPIQLFLTYKIVEYFHKKDSSIANVELTNDA